MRQPEARIDTVEAHGGRLVVERSLSFTGIRTIVALGPPTSGSAGRLRVCCDDIVRSARQLAKFGHFLQEGKKRIDRAVLQEFLAAG